MVDSEIMMNSLPTQTTFVYDRNSGEVVHIHQFVPAEPDGRCSEEEMEETALRLAPKSFDGNRLAILHEGALQISPEYLYRVEVDSGRLVTETVPSTPVSGG
jgi:hypothetical protein